ncbi:unnamed protein product [Tuber aestivum]|uniref:Uncharacterized protein n=1 Tax=Tuber aestivum TaxID=59557 RepID=A0A292Q7Q5_9PEZI|nr:unnamed protein product [Tuber aestivum]
MPPKRRPNKSAARSRPAAAVAEPEEAIEVAPTAPTAETAPPPNSSENPLFLPGYSDSSSDDDNDNGSNNGSVEIIPPPPPPPPPPAAAEPPPPPPSQSVPKPIVQPPPLGNEDDDTSGGEETTEEDPVVQTYDIQITTSQLRDLYIFQYPVRPREQPYTKARNACPVEARFKPKSGLVEVDIPVNVHVNYDEEKGRVWGDAMRKAEKEAGKAQSGGSGSGRGGGVASGVGGKKRKILRGEDDNDEEEEGEGEEDLMYMDLAAAIKAGRILNRQTLGSKMQPDGTKYMAGVFKNDKLYLTPITSTLQLRPQFHHIDTQIDLERAANKALHPVKQEARAIQLSVKNSEDPSSQLSSSMKAVRMAEEENWTKLHWVDQDTDDAWGVYEDVCLTGETKEEEGEGEGVKDELLKCVTTKREYVEWLSAGKPIVRKEGGGK